MSEADNFYGRPDTTADFDYWSKSPYWTLDEATALSLGLEPRIVHWEDLKGVANEVPSPGEEVPFPIQYARRRDLLLRANEVKQLADQFPPLVFVDWANRCRLILPYELETQVRAIAQTDDWKSLYEEAKPQLDNANTENQKLQEEIARLEYQLSQRQDVRNDFVGGEPDKKAKPRAKWADTKEQNSLLTLVLGLTKIAYNFDPTTSHGKMAEHIELDLKQYTTKFHIHKGTIEKYLDQAVELLSD
jgi:hypothetical protein